MSIDEPLERLGCERCGADNAGVAAENRLQLENVAELVDESHFSVRILQCSDCSQRWVHIFTEWIDWKDGDDAQYWSLLPVTKSESDELQGQREDFITKRLNQIGANRRYLQVDYPTGKPPRMRWANGNLLIGPHD